MENKEDIHQFLSDQMTTDALNLTEPRLDLVSEARKKVMARKKQTSSEIEDFFSMIAAFFNFRIKLYHAVIVMVITGGIIFYATQDDHDNKDESRGSGYISNIASVRSSTVLSSIYTFGLNKTQDYGRTSN